MNDPIERQDAIDAIRNEFKKSPTTAIRTMEVLKGLPPAQPEITLESAIDYLHRIGWMQEHDRILTESAQPDIAEKLYQYKCYITDQEGLQHEVIHVGDIRRVTGWMI